MSDLPQTTGTKFARVHDLAILYAIKTFEEVEDALSQDVATKYLYYIPQMAPTVCLSAQKTVCSVFT